MGIGMLYERVRWYSAVEATGDPFKLNNNYRSFYARKLMAEHKELRGIFELRTSVADNVDVKAVKVFVEKLLPKLEPAPLESQGDLLGEQQ